MISHCQNIEKSLKNGKYLPKSEAMEKKVITIFDRNQTQPYQCQQSPLFSLYSALFFL